ncbi:MAG TPA: DUF4158 domain-containing protein, partial [Beijerinckiaceae bacterium]|nr:DUF4158 domain-containing protein [Beijerinckiaceae bacterium]
GFAVMLLFFRERGRFPRGPGEVDAGIIAELARGLDVPEPNPDALFPFGAAERTLERQRAEIRALFAFREATIADAEALGIWLRDHAVAGTRDIGRLAAALEERCRAIAIEPPTPDRIERIVRAAIHAHEERFAATVHDRLPPEARKRLDGLLHPARAGPVANFFRPVGELRENAARSSFWLYVEVLRRSKPYLWLRRGRFGRAQFARKPSVGKLCDRPAYAG